MYFFTGTTFSPRKEVNSIFFKTGHFSKIIKYRFNFRVDVDPDSLRWTPVLSGPASLYGSPYKRDGTSFYFGRSGPSPEKRPNVRKPVTSSESSSEDDDDEEKVKKVEKSSKKKKKLDAAKKNLSESLKKTEEKPKKGRKKKSDEEAATSDENKNLATSDEHDDQVSTS